MKRSRTVLKARAAAWRAVALVLFLGKVDGAPTVAGGDFEFAEVCRVPPESALIVASEIEGKRRFYVAAGTRILAAAEGQEARPLAELPRPARQLLPVSVPRPGAVFALTASGQGYAVTPDGATSVVTSSVAPPLESVAFTDLPLYSKKPHALVRTAKGGAVCRLAWGPPKGSSQGASLDVEETLGLLRGSIAAFGFCENPGNWGLLALGTGGDLVRVDCLGTPMPYAKSRSLAGASCFVVDELGVFGDALLVSVPSKGEIWQVLPGAKAKRLARGLDEPAGGGAYQGALSMGPDGTAYVLAGDRILALGAPQGSAFAASILAAREALRLFGAGSWEEADGLLAHALDEAKGPRHWIVRLRELRLACQGAVKLNAAREFARKQGYAPALPLAEKLERAYGAARKLAPELALFRKQCEVARNVIMAADFEDEEAPSPGVAPAKVEAVNSQIRRAALPEPVKEGRYSLRWRVPERRGATAMLTFKAPQWGHCDRFSGVSLWVYSTRDRFNMDLSTINSTNAELARYTVNLRRGWQQFVRPPVYARMEETPADLMLGGIVLEVVTGGSNVIHVDDVRVVGRYAEK